MQGEGGNHAGTTCPLCHKKSSWRAPRPAATQTLQLPLMQAPFLRAAITPHGTARTTSTSPRTAWRKGEGAVPCSARPCTVTVLEDSLHIQAVGGTGLVVRAALQVVGELPGPGVVDDARVRGADGIWKQRGGGQVRELGPLPCPAGGRDSTHQGHQVRPALPRQDTDPAQPRPGHRPRAPSLEA